MFKKIVIEKKEPVPIENRHVERFVHKLCIDKIVSIKPRNVIRNPVDFSLRASSQQDSVKRGEL